MTSAAPSSTARIRALLRTCWSRATSTRWSAENPARGQCGVTALVIQDHLGGQILKTQVAGAWHFYNRIEGTRLDFTAEQFDCGLDYQDRLSDRAEAFADTDTAQYTALSAAFARALRRQAADHWTPLTDDATIRNGGAGRGGPRCMYRILNARTLAPDVRLFEVEAPLIARKRQAGQFVIVRVHERGERIPLTIADSDPGRGSIKIIVQGVGKTTKLLNSLEEGDALLDVVGPLGRASEVARFGTVVVVGGGVGTAIAFPTAVALKQAGNRVIGIIGGRTRALVILEDELRATVDELQVTTDDGSYGAQGLATDRLRALIAGGERLDYVLAIGPVPMMRAVAETTRPHSIKTVVSLNSIMVDGTGMCGGCRVEVGGKSLFACVDGPEFDAHQVDFAVLAQRNAMYRAAEARSLEAFLAGAAGAHECRLKGLSS